MLTQDEVDDTRTTLSYAINELQQDLEKQVGAELESDCYLVFKAEDAFHCQLSALSEEKRKTIPKTEFAIFVGESLLNTECHGDVWNAMN